MCPRRIRQLMSEIESGRLVRYSNSEGISLSAAARRRQPAADPPLHFPLTHGTEPEWFYACERNDIS